MGKQIRRQSISKKLAMDWLTITFGRKKFELNKVRHVPGLVYVGNTTYCRIISIFAVVKTTNNHSAEDDLRAVRKASRGRIPPSITGYRYSISTSEADELTCLRSNGDQRDPRKLRRRHLAVE